MDGLDAALADVRAVTDFGVACAEAEARVDGLALDAPATPHCR